MRILSILTAVAIGLGCAGPQSSPETADGDSDTALAASGPGFQITVAEVDKESRERLYYKETGGAQRHLVYNLRRDTLQSMIEQRLLEAEAERRGVDVNAFLEAETKPVSPADIDRFFTENAARIPAGNRGEMEPRVIQYLEDQSRAQTVASLVESADVSIALSPPRFTVEPIGPSVGPANAKVTIVEFSDFQCPFCTRVRPVLAEVLQRHPEDVRLVYRHLPLANIHPRAYPAALAAACADDQGKFWEYHDELFDDPGELADADFGRLATKVGISDLPAFDACLGSEDTRARVDADIAAAQSAGISGTPAFLVNGVLITGAQPVERFEELIAAEL